MNDQYTIGELAKKVGLSAKTIRYYEEIGLINPVKRLDNGYRLYDASASSELMLIKDVRNLGLPIQTMKKLMQGCTDGNCDHTKQEIETEIDTYLSLLNERILQLTTLRNKLSQLHKNIEIPKACDNTMYCCNILHQLTTVKGGEYNE